MIWGGERSTKTIKLEELNQLFADYVNEVYKKVGIKVTGKQKSKKIGNYKKKKKEQIEYNDSQTRIIRNYLLRAFFCIIFLLVLIAH